jgi:DNA-binding transcriptional LysR family regulator
VDLDLRRLRYFVLVADELSFTRAATLLHMTQPALSRQIRFLEEDLGVVLLERDRRGTALTDAGRQLLEDARPILASSAALERRARVAARGEVRFTIGFMPGVDATPIIRKFTAFASHLRIDFLYTSIIDQVDYLLDGRVDVCFVRLPIPTRSLTVVPLFPEPRVAALPDDHPLATSDALSIDELRDLPLLQDPRDVPEWRGITGWQPAGYAKPGPRPPTIEESLERVASSAGFYVLPAGLASYYHHAHIRYVPLQDVEARMVALAHTTHRTMPELHQFAEIAKELLQSPGT